MSIKLMDGQKVVDFRIPETTIKEEVKATKQINTPAEKEEFDILTSKWTKIFAVALIVIVAVFEFAIPKKSLDERLGNKIGAYEYTHKLPTGEPVYRTVTPRGHEWIVGKNNLDMSLEIYAETGVEGKDFNEVKEADIYPDLVKSLDLIEMEIKLEEERIKEFDKEFLKEEK